MKIIIKGTKTVEEYKDVYARLQQYGEEHEAEVMRWEWGVVTSDGKPVTI